MTTVAVKYYSVFCKAANFYREEQLQLGRDETLRELVDLLAHKYGEEFKAKLFDTVGNLRITAWVLVNGDRVRSGQFDQRLKFGDTVIFTSPLLVGG